MTVQKQGVYILTDWPALQQGLRAIVEKEPDLTVSYVSADVQSILAETKQNRGIEVILISLNPLEALAVTKTLKSVRPKLRAIVFSAIYAEHYARRIFRAGACGLITLSETPQAILGAIRQVVAGGICINVKVGAPIGRLDDAHSALASQEEYFWRFSNRERQVFRMIGKGMSALQIAKRLRLSKKTVHSFIARLKKKAAVKNRNDLLRIAIRSEDLADWAT